MAGMTTTGLSGLSDRTAIIHVSGVRHQDTLKTSNYTLKVPYSRMSQTMQNINRTGGKVTGVRVVPSTGKAPAKAPAKAPEKKAEE